MATIITEFTLSLLQCTKYVYDRYKQTNALGRCLGSVFSWAFEHLELISFSYKIIQFKQSPVKVIL